MGFRPQARPEMFEGIKETARQAGRDPSELELVMRANVELTETSLGDDRGPFCGTTDQIAADIAETKEIGATQLPFHPSFDPNARLLDDYISRIKLYADLVK